MCGIAAIYAYGTSSAPVGADEIIRMRDQMVKRGPDGAGLWISEDRRIAFGHRRLSIIEVSDAGAQPMATSDGQLRIVFNGEIYNYKALRAELQARGHVFQSASDTEVLLHAYREYGQGMVSRLRGMYAFAIWDEQQNGLFLARDPFGIKPLYYHDNGRTFRLASQVKAILASGIATQVEPAGHVGFYLWGSVPEPYTLYKDVLALPAGHTLWIDQHGPRVPCKYFDVADELISKPFVASQDTATVLSKAIRDSVRHHLIADVPVGLFLSSGIDSATLAGLASEERQELVAITLSFEEYSGTIDDESPLAKKIAKQYGCKHHLAHIVRSDFDDECDTILQAMDQPSVDGVNTYFVARAARQVGLKAALSGVGGDELLGGYPSFQQVPALAGALGVFSHMPKTGKFFRVTLAPLIKRFTSPKYASLFEYGGSINGAYLLRRGMYMPWELPEFLDGELVRQGWGTLEPLLANKPSLTPYAGVTTLEMTLYMRNMLLRDADWAGMAHSVEIRTPFVDIDMFRALAPYIANDVLPPRKRDLRRVPRHPAPPEVFTRRKTGFSLPIAKWTASPTWSKGELGIKGWADKVMSRQLITKTPPNAPRILIFRIGSIGDTCVAIPAFRLVRKRFPDSNIRVLTNFPVGNGIKAAPLQSVMGDSGLVDGYFEYPLGYDSLAAVTKCTASLKQWQPDVLVYMMPQRSSWQLARDYIFFRFVVGIRSIVGLSLNRASQRTAWNKSKQLYDSEASRILKNLVDLGTTDIADPMQWDLGVENEFAQPCIQLDFFLSANPFLACSVGTKVDTKHWGEDRWKDWAHRLSAELPTLTLVLFGASIEFDESERVARSWSGPIVNLCGKLTPRESAALLRKAIAFVGHDSGPMHLAASVGTPCVAIFSAREMPGIWFPFGTGHQVFYRQTECAGCRLEVCTEYQKKCIRSIRVDEILTATRNLILKHSVAQEESA